LFFFFDLVGWHGHCPKKSAEGNLITGRKAMKLLVSYDGSSCSEAAIDDLVRAGLPDEGQAIVLTVAEVWLPPPGSNEKNTGIRLDAETARIIEKHREKAEHEVVAAQSLANRAKQRLQLILPQWEISAEATSGSPAWEILSRAARFNPDLIVAGSHGRSAISRFVLGSISQKVLTEAHCSVRVARGRVEVDPTPMRLVIGFDTSKGAGAAVKAVAARNWREDTEVLLIAVTSPVTPSIIGKMIPPIAHLAREVNEAERAWLEKAAGKALRALRKRGLQASLCIGEGNPKYVLVEQAENWHADCIFVGANAFGSRVEKFLIGSTSAAVAAHAHCSVEVVRKKPRRRLKRRSDD
jgi:nucleotide-binding universal stress UspA family protein